MMKNILILFKILLKDLSKAYLFILLYPFKIFKEYFINNNGYIYIKSFFFRWVLIPFTGLLFYLSYFMIVKPLKRFLLNFIITELYNSKLFYREFEKSDTFIYTPENIYKYLLYNRNFKTKKFPDPEINEDDLFTFLMYVRKVISPGWRQHHLHFYHEDMKEYRDKMYEDAIRIHVRKAAESKVFDSFNVALHNFILLYRYVGSSLSSYSYELLCYIRFKYTLKVLRFDTKKLYQFLYQLLYLLFKFNFLWIRFLSIAYYRFLLEILSLNEEGTERSMYYSKRFGFSGNLYLESSYFIKEWNLNLTRSSDLGKDSVLADYTFDNDFPDREGFGNKVVRRFYIDKIRDQINKYDYYNDMNYNNRSELDTTDDLKLSMMRHRLQQKYRTHTKVYRALLDDRYTHSIHQDLYKQFYKRFKFYSTLYSVFGKLTFLLVKLFGGFNLFPLNKAQNQSLISSKFQNKYFDLDRYFFLFILFLLVESSLFILHTINS